ncbi:hypothetical protein Bbelb_260780 [Branchiostoma belcheri]|nr:hypothetical protein Bbelb_260780 [Branchiostoma belcheri]
MAGIELTLCLFSQQKKIVLEQKRIFKAIIPHGSSNEETILSGYGLNFRVRLERSLMGVVTGILVTLTCDLFLNGGGFLQVVGVQPTSGPVEALRRAPGFNWATGRSVGTRCEFCRGVSRQPCKTPAECVVTPGGGEFLV